MRRILCIALLLGLPVGGSAAPSRPKPTPTAGPTSTPTPDDPKNPGGYGKTQWGMTRSEVLALYPDAEDGQLHRVKLAEPTLIRFSEIVDAKFRIIFVFAGEGNGLKSVYLWAESKQDIASVSQKVVASLTEKYGPPASHKGDENYRRGPLGPEWSREAIWSFPRTSITFKASGTIFRGSNEKDELLKITYSAHASDSGL